MSSSSEHVRRRQAAGGLTCAATELPKAADTGAPANPGSPGAMLLWPALTGGFGNGLSWTPCRPGSAPRIHGSLAAVRPPTQRWGVELPNPGGTRMEGPPGLGSLARSASSSAGGLAAAPGSGFEHAAGRGAGERAAWKPAAMLSSSCTRSAESRTPRHALIAGCSSSQQQQRQPC